MGVKTEDGTGKEAEYFRGKGVWGSGGIRREKYVFNTFGLGQKKLR